jgi:Tol biopolymer transport system component/tRNA A-37 threonylcarbamoyl transferase component Bud32
LSPLYGELEAGTLIARYRIVSLIGSGGMGAVYLADHLTLHSRVALKVVRPDIAHDDGFRERFLREARGAASLDHPHIVPVTDAGEADGRLFLAMRYVPGTDLARVLREGGPLEPARCIAILRQIAEALDEAHANGLVHSDVKPANVLLAEPSSRRSSDQAYLTDFGLVKPAEADRQTAAGVFMGTRDYAAPELLVSHDVDGRADQYALACVVFECLTGSVPFPREFEAEVITAHLVLEPPPVAELRGELPGELDAVIRRGMEKDRERRFERCADLIEAAAVALGLAPTELARTERSLPAPRGVLPARAPRTLDVGRTWLRRVRPRAPIAVAVAIVVLAAGALWWLAPWTSGGPGPCGVPAGGLEAQLAEVGGRIAFVSDRSGSRDLYVLDIAAGTTHRVTVDAATEGNPTWSPDGTRIAFDSDREGPFEIYVMNADGSDVRRITDDEAADVSPAWSPDGGSIAFASTRDGNNEIYVVDLETGQERRITHNAAHDGQPTWSPDGAAIAFTSDRTGNPDIFVMNAHGSEPTNLTRTPSDDRKPAWSPAGDTIAFASDRDGDFDVYLMNADGTRTRAFTRNVATDGYPAWSPDGSWILFDTPVEGGADVCAAPADGSGGIDLVPGPATDAVTAWTAS